MSRGDLSDFIRDKLGHEARDLSLFELALTHKSLGTGQDYERLEFLGDRVLGMVIAKALYDRYPSESEGFLSRRYNVLVAREMCAENAREIGVPALVRLGKQARTDRANDSDNVVGDVIEALIGALLVDGGLEAAQRFVLKLWEPDLAGQRKAPHHPKSALQELAAARGLKAPVYEVVAKTGAHHAPHFTILVTVAGLGEASATGTSKQDAETDAAAELLRTLEGTNTLRQT